MKAIRLIATLACGLALQGCAGALVQDDWLPQPTHPALRPHHVVVAAADLRRVCGSYPGMALYGCAVRAVADRVCIIYTGPQPAAWLLEHERKHCAGWDHGPYPVRNDVRVAAVGPEWKESP